MSEIRCFACGFRPKSAGQNPPPSWWVDPLGPDTALCEDCKELRETLQIVAARSGVLISPQDVKDYRLARERLERQVDGRMNFTRSLILAMAGMN